MVNIYLNIEGRQVLALSIPFSDIARLSIRPVKWLRFVTFAICGVRGELSAMRNGPAVDYDSISLAGPIAEAYYYSAEGDYHFIDYNALNDRITSSSETIRSSSFRTEVMARDGPLCVFTGNDSSICDAAHILPKSKGDEYIAVVYQDRLNSYNPAPEPEIPGINSVENGIFLRKDLHSLFGHGHTAFLKTPNFALNTDDIPRVEVDPMPDSRITLQHLKPDTSRHPVPQPDACIAGMGILPPPNVLLDFMYGVAAYRCWGSGQDISNVMQHHFTKCYEPIPIPPASPVSSKDDRGGNHRSSMSDGMLHAMDNVLMLSMLVKGTTPQLMAAERQRQEEEEELYAKKASQVKVQQWMQSSPDVEFCRDIELSRSLLTVAGAVTYPVATPSFRSAAAFHSLVSLLIYTLPVCSRALRALVTCNRGL